MKRKRETGLTLIELMVAMAIVSIIIIGVVRVFGSSYQSYVTQNDVASVQQNIRVAKIFLEKDLRRIGYEMGEEFNWLGEPLPTFEFENGAGENESDRFLLRYVELVGGCGTPPGGETPCSDLPQLHLDVQFSGGQPLNAEIQEDLGADWGQDCGCGALVFDGEFPNFIGIIRSPDHKVSDTFILTSVDSDLNKINGQIVANYNGPIADLSGEDFNNTILNDYPENSTIEFFSYDSLVAAQYYVLNGFLWRNNERIAEHVEDMQFAFCGDFNNDGVANTEDAGDWLDETDLTGGGDLTEDDRAKVRYVRVTLLGRTLKEYQSLSSTRPTIEDHAGDGAQDHFRRRLLQVTVQLRNVALVGN